MDKIRLMPKNDFIFQKIFGKQENKEILLSFLNAVFNLPEGKRLSDIKVLDNTRLEPERIENKTGILDVRAETAEGTQINIEIQLLNQYNMDKRTLFYWSRMYAGQMKSGENFKELKKTVTINVLDFNYLKIKRYHNVFHLREDHEKDFMLTDVMEIHFLELPKFREISADINDALQRWLMFLDNVNEEVLEVLKMADPAIAKAEQILDWLSCDKETLRLYDLRQKAVYDEVTRIEGARDEGMQEGIEKGIEKGKAEVAKSMLKKGSDIAFVAEVTGMSESEVLELNEEVAKDKN